MFYFLSLWFRSDQAPTATNSHQLTQLGTLRLARMASAPPATREPDAECTFDTKQDPWCCSMRPGCKCVPAELDPEAVAEVGDLLAC